MNNLKNQTIEILAQDYRFSHQYLKIITFIFTGVYDNLDNSTRKKLILEELPNSSETEDMRKIR